MANSVYDPEDQDTPKSFAPVGSFDGDVHKRLLNKENRAAGAAGGTAQSGTGIANAGASGAAAPTAAETSERSELKNGGGGLYTGDDDDDDQPRGPRGWSAKKKAVTGGIAGFLGLGAVTGIFLLSSGPLQFLHFAQLEMGFHFGNSDSFTDGRAADLIKYARHRNNPENRNLEFFGNKIADHYTAKLNEGGIHFEYEGGFGGGRFSGVNIDPNTPEGERALSTLADDFDINTVNDEGLVHIDLSGESASVRRATITTTVEALGMEGTSNALAARLLKIRGGVSFHPLKNIARAADEKFFNYVDERIKQQNDYIAEGTSESVGTVAVGDEAPDSTGSEAPDPQATAQTDDAAAAANAAAATATDPDLPVRTRAETLTSGLGTVAGIAGVGALICGLQQIGESAAVLQTANVVKPLIRSGTEIISIASQIQSGQGVNLDELGALSRTLYDSQDKTSWIQAQSIQANLGHPDRGVPMDPAAIPGTSKPFFFNEIDALIGAAHAEPFCDAVTSTAGNITLTVTGIVFSATGPFSLALNAGGQVAQTILSERFMPGLVRWIAGSAIATDVKGAMRGNFADYGVFLANNDRMSSLGGRELTGTEVAQLNQERAADKRIKMKQESFYARVLDLKQPDSLAAKTILENPSFASTQSFAASLPVAPLRSLSSIFTNLANIFIPRSFAAATSTYDYGVPAIGFSVAELNSDVAKEDPYANATYVEANLTRLNDKYGDCSATKINSTTGKIETTNVTSYIGKPAQCNDNDPDRLRLAFYLADMTVAQGLVCYPEGLDEASCSNLGFDTQANSDTASGELPTDVVGADQIVDIPPWLDIGSGCYEGIAEKTKQMFEAAQADGVFLTGACWRSAEAQMDLRRKNCPDPLNSPASACSPPTALPGRSNHERGLAIDFHNCSSRSTECWIWLNANAARFGFQNLPSEPWHWSVDGR